MTSKKNRLITCGIVSKFDLNFGKDTRAKQKTDALEGCEYRKVGSFAFCGRTTICEHPKAGTKDENFLTNFCPAARAFSGR